MDTAPTFSADTETALWQQVAADMARTPDLLEYTATLHQNGYQVQLELNIDLGGGFESGYETTTFRAVVPGQTALHFALHEQDWVHELGKLLGLQDVELGDPELNAAYIVSTNHPDQLRALLLSDPVVRQTLLQYQELRLDLTADPAAPQAGTLLTFTKEQALTNPAQLQEIYHMLLVLLRQLAPKPLAAAGGPDSGR
ncbi:hypothetical protein [Hymenobacter yonginensis]|uniref:Uncharacterized protein n=1 Tax=Hymenobacter yonginensis TaxID=748197 RepID=A0ABY7PQS6_9BACT|nr:hypothetical protein [Hymenobacter yonginensis]WBO84743.1 hypothetical protein O9Z63_00530 [Hymenobacter yonginensis]